ncbi:M28 family peptidase [bacterium]|nr:M28 family peptidase [bacterium]
MRSAARFVLLTLLSLALGAQALQAMKVGEAEKEALMDHIRYLADDAREGRGIGTPGLDSSAAYLADRFRHYGLQPLFDGDYYQRFDMAWGAEAQEGCYLAMSEDTLMLGADVLPSGFSGIGEVQAPILFAGYGIAAPEYEYDDYGEVDATGSIVLVLEGEPAEEVEGSLFAGTMTTDHSMLRTKAITAKNQGAVGVVVVTRDNTLPTLSTDEPYRDVGIPVLLATPSSLKALFPRLDFAKLRRSIDANESPRSMEAGDEPVTMSVQMTRNQVPVSNVGAKIEGSDEVVIIGAHYDHLGYGQMGSTEYGIHAIHNGADDNASGTAVLLELAHYFAEHPVGPTLWFVGFTGEEVGLVGSNWFVNHPAASLDNATFMLNIDMVGRTVDHKLTVYGVHSAKGLKEMAQAAGEGSPMTLTYTGGGYGASDQTSFYVKGIPVLHLLGALHEDYHTSRDDFDKINFDGLVEVLDYGVRLINEAAKPETKLEYQEKAPPSGGGGRSNITVSMGTIPDFSQPDSLRGLRIQGVRSGAPADEAGMTGMDVIVKMDDIIIDNIYDFTYALKQYKPGDVVKVTYLREGTEQITDLTLAASTRGRRGGGGGGHPGSDKKEGGHPGGGK